MTEDSTTYYRYIDTEGGRQIDVTLDESISDGMVTVAINKQLAGGMARIGTMTINSKRITHETLNNINTVLERTYVESIFTAVFAAVKNTDGENDENDT
jgi:aspartate aminotransferase-like enzyme